MAATTVKERFQLPPEAPATDDDANLIHWPEGEARAKAGEDIATYVDALMRSRAESKTDAQRVNQALCTGCTTLAVINAGIVLAKRNGTSRHDFANMLRTAADEIEAEIPVAELIRMLRS